MNIHKIQKLLPHRYPFLLVDRVTELKVGESIRAYKNVSINEPFFNGHFPGKPVMPGVLVLEALAQAAGLLSFETMGEAPGDDKVFYFVGIDNARFKKPVVPGDQLVLEVGIDRVRAGIYKFKAVAKVEGQVVCEADLMCTMREFDQN
ncbi:3-hydroxyacyl-[acyl-carrier-protein] dehydratase FabZ [Corticibacter populi]|uniref:3-hydroxyacyl-[acyl-carrier-protein] dehydratase FabZ n=1 Tax=Corticibacter populi TaxID=1550736 RepID=A0A3M6QRD9_9BURK|nr:3-hydroxyacyl-ACP dehydratase FabZ [Corticibacter populi]RMX05618.1 3-hydroxyacyl-[acyl-carrier-protein] dehydratase FabZ [Corticibacter populi]